MPRYLAFLRAINLGSRNRVAMADLRALLEGLGHRDVVTHLVSGNAAFTAARASEDSLVAGIEGAIADRLGLTINVLVRTPDQLARVLQQNPLKQAESDPKRLAITLLDAAPTADRIAAFDGTAFGADVIAIVDRAVYAWYRDGIGGSRLGITTIEKRLGVTGTGRNWDTLTRMLELGRQPERSAPS
jgi:uncharacterized protein (DUF1697 family)